MYRCILLGLLLSAFVPIRGYPQNTGASEQADLVKTLLQRIEKLERKAAEVDQLEQRLAELEAKQGSRPEVAAAVDAHRGGGLTAAAIPAAPTLTPPVAPTTTQMEDHGGLPQTNNLHEQQFPALHIRGFGNLDFSATDQPKTNSGFNMGQFILHLASPISPKVNVFGEVSFTAQSTGYSLDLERSLIRYDYNDYFKLSFGRYHTPINYWNTTYHHGLWLQTTISRPEMIRFGGRFQPVHFVGIQVEGDIPSGPVGLGYVAGVGNGRAGNIARPGDNGDVNNNRAVVASIFSRPRRWNALQIGGAVYHDKITPLPELPGNPSFKEWITSAHLVWSRETPEFISEFAAVRHRNELTSALYISRAVYAQVAYRLPGPAHKLKPYYRFEFSNIAGNDPLFAVSDPAVAVRDLNGSTAGLRYDIINLAAFKAEYRRVRRTPTEPAVNGFFAQTSFTF